MDYFETMKAFEKLSKKVRYCTVCNEFTINQNCCGDSTILGTEHLEFILECNSEHKEHISNLNGQLNSSILENRINTLTNTTLNDKLNKCLYQLEKLDRKVLLYKEIVKRFIVWAFIALLFLPYIYAFYLLFKA